MSSRLSVKQVITQGYSTHPGNLLTMKIEKSTFYFHGIMPK